MYLLEPYGPQACGSVRTGSLACELPTRNTGNKTREIPAEAYLENMAEGYLEILAKSTWKS
jgi:hypothetical protein